MKLFRDCLGRIKFTLYLSDQYAFRDIRGPPFILPSDSVSGVVTPESGDQLPDIASYFYVLFFVCAFVFNIPSRCHKTVIF